MKRGEYLTRQEQYSLVYNSGKSWAGNLLSMRLLPNGLIFSRYGFVVSKRVGKAVVRNRIKRLLREILRQTSLKPGWDIVFYARLAAADASFADLKNLILSLLSRAQLLMENYEKVCPRTN
jgi:ribonuclease P protein component